MQDFITIEGLCKDLNGFSDRETIDNTVNKIHFLLTKYFLSIDEDIKNISNLELKKLKEIGIYLFDIAIDDLFENDLKEKTRKVIFGLTQNIFEQLCRVYQNEDNKFLNEYLELTFLAIGCAAIGNNPAKAHVLFKRYVENFVNTDTVEEKIIVLLNAYLAKCYKFTMEGKDQILNTLNSNSIDTDVNGVFLQLLYSVTDMIGYFKSGDESIVSSVFNNLEMLRKYSSDNNLYKELWILKVFKKHLLVSTRRSIWRVLGNVLEPNLIKLFVEDTERPLYELWEHQKQIVEAIIFSNRHNIINIPTSSGKSLIAQLAILKILSESKEATCVYVVPTNALLNQVKNDLNNILEGTRIGVGTIISGYDILNSELENDQLDSFRVIVVTQEKLDSLIRRDEGFIGRCKLFIFDEFQNISKGSRGLLLEFVITKIKHFNIGNEAKLLFLSSTLPNILSVKEWVGEEYTNIYSDVDCRPTRQVKSIGYFRGSMEEGETSSYLEKIDSHLKIYYDNGGIGEITFPTLNRFLSNKSNYYKIQNFCADISERFASIGNVLVYLPSTNWFKSFCKAMWEKEIVLSAQETNILNDIAEYIGLTMKDDHYLVKSIRMGVAYHHSRLPENIKRIIEIYFKMGIIKILASTSTLAQGLNFPISTIVVGSLMAGGSELSPSEFQNLIGRAGRAMRETEGYIVLALKQNIEFSRESNERYIKSLHGQYLSSETSHPETNSVIQLLIDALKKQEADLNNYEKEIIRTYNSMVFDLEQSGVLEDDASLEEIINALLFSVQSTEEDVVNLKVFTKEMVSSIKSKISTIEDQQIKVILKQSGLSIDSAITIYEAVMEFAESKIDSIFEGTRLNNQFITLINKVKNIPEFFIAGTDEFILNCINSWIFLSSYKDICEDFFNSDYDKCVDFISENINYKSSWFFSIIYQIFESLIVRKLNAQPYDLNLMGLLLDFSYLPAYCKFGVPNKTMIEVLEGGLYERELLIKANTLYEIHTNMVLNNAQVFYLWANSIDLLNLEDKNVMISKHENKLWKEYKESIREKTIIPKEIISISIKGYGRYDKKYLIKGEPLVLRHEPQNQNDVNAIEILTCEGKKMGYVAKDLNTEILSMIKNFTTWLVFDRFTNGELVCDLYVIK